MLLVLMACLMPVRHNLGGGILLALAYGLRQRNMSNFVARRAMLLKCEPRYGWGTQRRIAAFFDLLIQQLL